MRILQSEREMATNNKHLGEFTFDIDANNFLIIYVKTKASEVEIQKMVREAKMHAQGN